MINRRDAKRNVCFGGITIHQPAANETHERRRRRERKHGKTAKGALPKQIHRFTERTTKEKI